MRIKLPEEEPPATKSKLWVDADVADMVRRIARATGKELSEALRDMVRAHARERGWEVDPMPIDFAFSKPVFSPGVFRHYKGKLYRALMLVADHETQRELVLYVALENPHSLPQVRPFHRVEPEEDCWTDMVEIGSGGSANEPTRRVPRFEYQSGGNQSDPRK